MTWSRLESSWSNNCVTNVETGRKDCGPIEKLIKEGFGEECLKVADPRRSILTSFLLQGGMGHAGSLEVEGTLLGYPGQLLGDKGMVN